MQIPIPGTGPGGRRWILVSAMALPAILLRIAFLLDWPRNFDADEALVGVHAQQILRGQFTLFLPGQAYIGSLQSLIAAGLVRLFGASPTVVRLAPMLWILPGFFALRALQGRRPGGAWPLAVLWFFPPAVLFLMGVKAGRSYLEPMVLGLSAMALLLRPREATRWRAILRTGLAGLLLGAAVWTQDQALLFLPVAAALCLAAGRRGLALDLPSAAVGFVLGHLPLWMPRLAPSALGPPGTEGTNWHPEPGAFLRPEVFRDLFYSAQAALTTIPNTGTVSAILLWAYTLGFLCLCVLGAASWFRAAARSNRAFWKEDPPLAITLWLAVGAFGTMLTTPEFREDPQWFRYTFAASPFLILSAVRGWRRLSQPVGRVALVALALLGAHAAQQARSAWFYPPAPLRPALVRELAARGCRGVITRPELAYYVRFATADRVLASSYLPPRFPEVNARVTFSPQAWMLEERSGRRTQPLEPGADLASTFLLRPRDDPPPEDLALALNALDPRRTLYVRFEPWPILQPGEFPRDWRGLPYRRPLAMFDAIVWDPRGPCPIPDSVVRARLDSLRDSGAFVPAVETDAGVILRRPL